MRRFIYSIIALGAVLTLWAGSYHADILPGYSSREVEQGSDYHGQVVSTIIKRDTVVPGGRGVLYIHGFNDYFFQGQLGDTVVDHGWNFRAVDLRKYGRSLRSGQERFEARSLKEYFPDIDSAVVEMSRQGIDTIVIMAHSTGGLIASLYMDRDDAPAEVRGLILNSPFLAWRMSWFMRDIAVPAVSFLGRFWPGMKISQGASGTYAHSLLRQYAGEWDYDTTMKLIISPDVTAGWVRAIDRGQKYLRHHKYGIQVPVLLMHSARTVSGSEASSGDAVLNVDDISKYGHTLSHDLTEVTIENGLHDLILSRREARDEVYRDIFKFLERFTAPGDVVEQHCR